MVGHDGKLRPCQPADDEVMGPGSECVRECVSKCVCVCLLPVSHRVGSSIKSCCENKSQSTAFIRAWHHGAAQRLVQRVLEKKKKKSKKKVRGWKNCEPGQTRWHFNKSNKYIYISIYMKINNRALIQANFQPLLKICFFTLRNYRAAAASAGRLAICRLLYHILSFQSSLLRFSSFISSSSSGA